MSPQVTLVRTATDIDARAVGVFSDRMLDEGIDLDWAFLAADGFSGKPGETRSLPGEEGVAYVVVGLGPADDVGADQFRIAASAAARAMRRHRTVAVTLLEAVPDAVDLRRAAQAVAEGIVLGCYDYTRYRSEPEPSQTEAVQVCGVGGKRIQTALDRGVLVAGAVCLARDLVNEPGGSLTPRAFAQRSFEVAEETGLKITVLDEVDIEVAKLGGLLGVNRGSTEPPRLVQLRYEPDKPKGTVALVGKGITFDSGGLSLKPSDGMRTMKCDMGGAAAVLAAMSVLPALAPRVRVLGYLPLTDNMPGPDATRVGDVLVIRDGTTVEVLNTDAEGRLVLADGLAMATEESPDAIVDLATLTGACIVALGVSIAGIMGNHDGWIDQVRRAATNGGEKVWPLPMPDEYDELLKSDIADLKNITGERDGGTLAAARFLSNFVGDGIAWAHLDIAGPAWTDKGDHLSPKGGTGYGVRTLVELITGFTKPR